MSEVVVAGEAMRVINHPTFEFDVGEGHVMRTSDERTANWVRGLLEQLELAEMQRARLLARVAAKDEEFAKERAVWKHTEARLRHEIRELRKGQ